MKWFPMLFVALAGLVLGCGQPSAEQVANGDDPIAALRSPVRSSRYDGGFWNREAQQETELWREAVEYCRTPGNSAAANCQIVGLVLSTIELERAARVAKEQLQKLVEQGHAFVPPPQSPSPATGQ